MLSLSDKLFCACVATIFVIQLSNISADTVFDVEQQIRSKIFSYAVGNKTEFNQLNDKDYCKYHIFTGALTNLWLHLSIAKDINDIIHEGIKDVIANRSSVDPTDVNALQETLDRIQERLKANPLLNEHYIDAKTAIETELANAENKTCKSDVTNPSTVSQSHRFLIHQRFLDETVKTVDPKCDPEGYNRTILALAVLRVSKKPDQRPAITQLYEDVISETVKNITYEFNLLQGEKNCPTIVHDPNVMNLFETLAEKIDRNDVLKGEVERAKIEVAPTVEVEEKSRNRRSKNEDEADDRNSEEI